MHLGKARENLSLTFLNYKKNVRVDLTVLASWNCYEKTTSCLANSEWLTLRTQSSNSDPSMIQRYFGGFGPTSNGLKLLLLSSYIFFFSSFLRFYFLKLALLAVDVPAWGILYPLLCLFPISSIGRLPKMISK